MEAIRPFSTACPTHYHFGSGILEGRIDQILPDRCRLALVVGKRPLEDTEAGYRMVNRLRKKAVDFIVWSVSSEPSVDQIDQAVFKLQKRSVDFVAAIGGGSALDAGKAISAMLPLNESIRPYLEGSPDHRAHPGKKRPFIAIPTTAGTGSELTKNAVITDRERSRKRSLRHIRFFPDIAIVDPTLTLSCPSLVSAASGMDALTQLIEGFVSKKANPWSDALAIEGIRCVSEALIEVSITNPDDITLREKMSWAASLSGWVLSQAGLGLVHGFASSIGGIFDIPHGVICARLLPSVLSANIDHIQNHSDNPDPLTLSKYIQVARILGWTENDPQTAAQYLVAILKQWQSILDIPSFGSLGVQSSHIDRIRSMTGQKENPVTLPDEILDGILRQNI